MTEDGTIYLAPDIRNQALHVLQARTDERRDRRMLAAIEVNQKKQAKLISSRSKSGEKFAKLVTAAAKRLDAARDLIEKAENELREATSISNSMTLLDEEIG